MSGKDAQLDAAIDFLKKEDAGNACNHT